MPQRPDESVIAWNGYVRMSLEPAEVVIEIDGVEVARSRRAVRFLEGTREPVYYIPKEDVRPEAKLAKSELKTTCRWKGEASYFSIVAAGKRYENLVWAYPEALEEVARIRGHVAFDTTRPQVAVKVGGTL